jgi:hypothetical protein
MLDLCKEKKLEFDDNETETSLANRIGIFQIYGVGNAKFIME